MTTLKKFTKQNIKSYNSSSASSSDNSSSSEAENIELQSIKTTKQSTKKNGFSFLDDLRQSTNPGTSRIVASVQMQISMAILFFACLGYFVLEPILPDQIARFRFFKLTTKNGQPPFSYRLGFVFLNNCISMALLLLAELYKVYLRVVSDIRYSTQMEISLSEQIKLNNRIKTAERVHIQSLSQLVFILFCQLSFAFDPNLINFLYRIVPAFNLMYLISRMADFYHPKRFRVFSYLIIYVPVSLCLIANIMVQFQKAIYILLKE